MGSVAACRRQRVEAAADFSAAAPSGWRAGLAATATTLTIARPFVVTATRTFARFAGRLELSVDGDDIFRLLGLLRLFGLLRSLGTGDCGIHGVTTSLFHYSR